MCRLFVGIVLLLSTRTYSETERLNPLTPLSLPLGGMGIAIIAPETEPYQAIASRLSQEMKRLCGTTPTIIPDTVRVQELGKGPVIVLGNLMDSSMARSLYVEGYDFTDYAWPSPGGYVVRTIRDPFGTGTHVVFVGGSDADGVSEGAKELVRVLEEHGPTLAYVNRVVLGRWGKEIKTYTEKLLGNDDSVWLRSGMSGSWEYMMQIAQAGLGYLRTGDEAYLPIFEREFRRWLDRDVYHPSQETPQQIHGFLYPLVTVWDLIRDHPHFTPETRLEFDEGFLFVLRSSEGPSRLDHELEKRVVRNNHGTRTALDAFFCGRYFLRRHGLEETKAWLEAAERYFVPQLASFKPVCDSWGHQWAASLYNTLIYAFATGRDEYFTSDAFRSAADRAFIAHPNGGGPRGYLSACAVAADDTGYLSGRHDVESLAEECAAMGGSGDELIRSFCTGRSVEPRDDLTGVSVAPVDPLWFKTIDAAGFNPAGLFENRIPREQAFDKVSLREGWGEDDYYLLFDGISGGLHSYQDGNCLVWYRERGVQWLSPTRDFTRSATVRRQNGVAVTLNGAGAGHLHRYSRLLYAGSSGNYLATGGCFEGVGEVDWERHIVRRLGRWTLVIDRIIPRTDGEVLAERFWHLQGSVTGLAGGIISEATVNGEQRWLHLRSAGASPIERMSGTSERREAIRARAVQDQAIELATVLVVRSEPGDPGTRIVRTERGWSVAFSDESPVVASVADDSAGIGVRDADGFQQIGSHSGLVSSGTGVGHRRSRISSTKALPLEISADPLEVDWRFLPATEGAVAAVAISRDGATAAGDEKGTVVVFDRQGNKLSTASFPKPILSLHFLSGDDGSPGDLLVGEDRGAITRLNRDGEQRWQVEIPYDPMAWPYWSEYRCRIREIGSADVTGDGTEEILVSNSDRRIYCLDSQGTKLWSAPVEWGIFTAMTPGRYQGRFALFGGTSKPSIHGWCIHYDAEGKRVRNIFRQDIVSWSNPTQFLDMRLVDVDGDGENEIVTALDTSTRQLIVYELDGSIRWNADVGGGALALAMQRQDGQENAPLWIDCSSSAGYVARFNGATGERAWTRYLGVSVPFFALARGNAVLAVSESGSVFLIDEQGEIVGRKDLGSRVTAYLRPGDHRRDEAMLLGLSDGRVVLGPRDR